MKEILIHTKTDRYPILIGSNFLTKLHSFTQKYDKILFLTNDTLFSHYSNLYEEKIASSKTEYYVLPDGIEYHKREDENGDTIEFYLNVTDKELSFSTISGDKLTLEPYGVKIF